MNFFLKFYRKNIIMEKKSQFFKFSKTNNNNFKGSDPHIEKSEYQIKKEKQIELENDECSVDVEFTRKLNTDARKLDYRKRTIEFKPPLHWGQRKLLLNEIEFLTQFGNLSKIVLYIGAADGKHIGLLANMFKKHKFILYDSNEFDNCLTSISNIEIKKQLFTDNDINLYKDQNVLMISDIRNMPNGYIKSLPDEMGDDLNIDLEEMVKLDMEMQKKWVLEIKPIMSMLKFRLPYKPGKTEYFDGDILFQAWAPPTSTETRLIVGKDIKYKIYDNVEYESIMYRFNRCTRIQPFELFDDLRLDNFNISKSYDLTTEIYIIHEYLKKIKNRDGDLSDEINKIIRDINKHLGKDFKEKYIEKKILFETRLIQIKEKEKEKDRKKFNKK